jgi:S1-C subfamily serine protease
MRKMLAIIGIFAFSGTAWALAPDRSALSIAENDTINVACYAMIKDGNSAFQSCVARQMAALKQHPTPDLSSLPPSRLRMLAENCNYLRRAGIAEYNDCLKDALAKPVEKSDKPPDPNDVFAFDFRKVFGDDPGNASKSGEKPKVTTVALSSLPKPPELLATRPDHLGTKPLSPEDVFKKVERSVFVVLATQSEAELRSGDIMQGSAIAVSDHLLLTNCHVVKDRAIIKLWQDGKRADAKLVAADEKTDRCILRTDDMTLTPITGVRAVSSLAIGEHVFAIGAPITLERTLSEGLISGIRPIGGRTLVQTSAPISPGSSGGGLFDDRGNLVGITTLASRNIAQNLNFAIAAAEYWK